MTLLVGKQFLEQLHGDVVAKLVADFARALLGGAGVVFAGKIRLKNFLDVLADAERSNLLQVRVAFEEDDARDDLIRVVHLFDRFLALLLSKLEVTPVFRRR